MKPRRAFSSQRSSHVYRVAGLLKAIVLWHICIHSRESATWLRCSSSSNFRHRTATSSRRTPRATCAIVHILVMLLERGLRVAEHAAVFCHFVVFGYGQAVVQHILVVADEGFIPAELVIEVILSVRKNVFLVGQRGSVWLISIWLGSLLVLPQVWVERALAMRRTVLGA